MQMRKEATVSREVAAREIPSGTPITLRVGDPVVITQSLGGSYTVMTPVGFLARIDGKDVELWISGQWGMFDGSFTLAAFEPSQCPGSPADALLSIEIEDTGSGIAAEQRRIVGNDWHGPLPG